MDRGRFQELQYVELRKEIERCLERAFQIMVGGAALIPILTGVISYYSATPILLTLPLIVIVTALLYLNQWNMIMRAGRYIRTRIEPEFVGNDGWEAWLETAPDSDVGSVHNRLVDTYLSYAFFLLSAAYYSGTSYVAVTYADRSYGSPARWISLAVYIVLGIVMGAIVLRRVPTNTTTKNERERAEQERSAAPSPVLGGVQGRSSSTAVPPAPGGPGGET